MSNTTIGPARLFSNDERKTYGEALRLINWWY